MSQYKAVSGQTIYDVCLNTYGTFDYLKKLMDDNSIENIDVEIVGGQTFEWDETLSDDQKVNRVASQNNIKYATKVLPNQTVDTVVKNGNSGAPVVVPGESESSPSVINYLPIFIGAVSNLNPPEATVTSLTTRKMPKQSQSFTYNITNQRFCFAFPTTFGGLANIKDTNGFDITSGFEITHANYTINSQIVSYTIYTFAFLTTQSNFVVTFNF